MAEVSMRGARCQGRSEDQAEKHHGTTYVSRVKTREQERGRRLATACNAPFAMIRSARDASPPATNLPPPPPPPLRASQQSSSWDSAPSSPFLSSATAGSPSGRFSTKRTLDIRRTGGPRTGGPRTGGGGGGRVG